MHNGIHYVFVLIIKKHVVIYKDYDAHVTMRLKTNKKTNYNPEKDDVLDKRNITGSREEVLSKSIILLIFMVICKEWIMNMVPK